MFLVVIGLTASVAAVPASFAVLGFIVGWVQTDASDPWPDEDVPVREIVLVWAITAPLAVGGLKYGLRLVRRHRTLVLFLRRFGDDEAQDAVSFAVLTTIGPSWRVVTLDDAEMKPIGIPPATRRLFRIGESGAKYVAAAGHFIGLRMFPILLWATWGVLAAAVAGPAFEFLITGTTSPEPWIEGIEPLVPIFSSALAGDPPVGAIAPTLPGVFALLCVLTYFSFLAMVLTMAVLLLSFPLSTVLFFLADSAKSVREAERAKAVRAMDEREVRAAVRQIAERSRKVLGARLVILHVASAVWRVAVRELAARASVVLIDVSEPTENVLWELQELDRVGAPSVLIGDYEQVAPLAQGELIGRDPLVERLAHVVAGREVLAYTIDPQGLRRFARALRNRLLEHGPLGPRPRPRIGPLPQALDDAG